MESIAELTKKLVIDNQNHAKVIVLLTDEQNAELAELYELASDRETMVFCSIRATAIGERHLFCNVLDRETAIKIKDLAEKGVIENAETHSPTK